MTVQQKIKEEVVLTNGINAAAIFETIDAVNENNEIATFRFRAKNKWMGGDLNRTTIENCYGACKNHNHEKGPFVLDNAEPQVLLGDGEAANPVEYLLHALVGCVTTSIVYHSAARGIDLEAIDTELEGDLDLRGFLGIFEEGSNGYDAIRMSMRIKTTATKEELMEMPKFSPVFGVVSRSVPIELSIETYQ